jgi:hypothetical protein
LDGTLPSVGWEGRKLGRVHPELANAPTHHCTPHVWPDGTIKRLQSGVIQLITPVINRTVAPRVYLQAAIISYIITTRPFQENPGRKGRFTGIWSDFL